MKIVQPYSHRMGLELFRNENDFTGLWEEVISVIEGIGEEEIIAHFNQYCLNNKSISDSINNLIDSKLVEKEWNRQSHIFVPKEFRRKRESRWTLDFAKENISIEVAFNHGEAVAWNLIKPVLASELNHVEKAIQTKAGIIITATDSMKKAGGFDGAVGSFEKYIQYLKPLNNMLTVPLVIIGLDAPESFKIEHYTVDGQRKKYGRIVRF